jgi:PAS domain S-box-containing protein
MLATAESIAQVGSWQWDVVHNVHTWSDEQYRILGRTAKATPPTLEEFLACIHPDDRLRVLAGVESDSLGGNSEDIEFRVVRPDGDERIILARRQVFRDKDGKPIRQVGTIHDVTERIRREREMAKLHADLVETVGNLQRRQREILLINELNETMQACNAQDEAYPLIARTAQELFPRASGALAMFVGQYRDLKTVALWGSARLMASEFAIADCWALRRGQIHEVPHPGKGAECRHFISTPPVPICACPWRFMARCWDCCI